MRDTVVWALPALVFGIVLRALFLWYSPLAYWGSDSRSFMGFTDGVLGEFYFSINEKRRYLYPLFLFPLSLLPGGTLAWLASVQALLGVVTLLPFAYAVRRCFSGWRLWIVPLTLLFAGLPVFLWYEHELIAEPLFFQASVWAMGGWAAWVMQTDPARARRLFWWFLVPFALMVLTKPSAKFLWPGVVAGLVLAGGWRFLRVREAGALAAVFLAGLTVGDGDQSAWLLYTTAFPLTRIDSPSHAAYKSEIRDWVLRERSDLAGCKTREDAVHDFLRSPEDHPEFPAWKALAEDEPALARLYNDLSIEAISSSPHQFLLLGIERLAASCNMSEFKLDRFEPDYGARRLARQMEQRRNPERMLRIAFGIPPDHPLPSPETFATRMNPHPQSFAARAVNRFVVAYTKRFDLLVRPLGPATPLKHSRPTPLGWWLALAMALSLLKPYRKTLGVLVGVCAGYLVLVYLVGISHTRYFAPVWPSLILLLALPADAVWNGLRKWRGHAGVPAIGPADKKEGAAR